MIKLVNILQEITIKPAISFNNTNDIVEAKITHGRGWILLDLGAFYGDEKNNNLILFPRKQVKIIKVLNKDNPNIPYFQHYFSKFEDLYKKGKYIIVNNQKDFDKIYG